MKGTVQERMVDVTIRKIKTVLFVPSTPNSELKSQLQMADD